MEGERAGWALGCVYHKSVPQIKKAEMDRKTLDWEIVELTNKLLLSFGGCWAQKP